MGTVHGREFKRNDQIEGQGKSLLLQAKNIHLRNKELSRMFYEYSKYEDRATFTIKVTDIMVCNKIKVSLFSEVYFQIFDLQKTGVLTFQQYMVAMWSLLTTTEDEMARLCWGLFDIEKTETLDLDEIKYLINVIWEFNPNKRCLKALRQLDLNVDGVITMKEFVLLCKHHPDLLLPVRQLKQRLQKRTVYSRFWKELTATRLENFGEKNVYEIWERVEPGYVQASMDYLNLRYDKVPMQYIEQWKLIQKRKASRGMVHTELPYEIREKIEPPLPKVKPAATPLKKSKSSRRSKGFNKYNSIADDPLYQKQDDEDDTNTVGSGSVAPSPFPASTRDWSLGAKYHVM